jgi:hypothetical protein
MITLPPKVRSDTRRSSLTHPLTRPAMCLTAQDHVAAALPISLSVAVPLTSSESARTTAQARVRSFIFAHPLTRPPWHVAAQAGIRELKTSIRNVFGKISKKNVGKLLVVNDDGTVGNPVTHEGLVDGITLKCTCVDARPKYTTSLATHPLSMHVYHCVICLNCHTHTNVSLTASR